MTPKSSRDREFAQLMAHHVLDDKHGNKMPAVVHIERVADKIRDEGNLTEAIEEDLRRAVEDWKRSFA